MSDHSLGVLPPGILLQVMLKLGDEVWGLMALLDRTDLARADLGVRLVLLSRAVSTSSSEA